MAAVAVAGVAAAPDQQPGFRDPDLGAVVLAGLQGLPLVARRRSPGWVLSVVAVGTVAFFAASYPPVTTALVAALVASYSVAAHGRPPVPVLGAVGSAVLVLALVGLGLARLDLSVGEAAALALSFVTAWVLGDRMRTRRAYLQALEERARRLEREREERAQSAAAEERRRIARELHDVVAHAVSVVVLHARGAKEVLRTDPEASRRSLDLIEDTGRRALAELRTVLGALRADEPDSGDRGPQPGLAQVGELVDETRAGGLLVEFDTEGEPRDVPAGVALSVFRIVQEALTNVRKHSTSARARVVLRYGPEELLVHVLDDGPSVRDGGPPGHGLTGMRERVALFGGRLEAGPRPAGGYEVLAVLPVKGDAR